MLDPRRRLLLLEVELQCGFALKAYTAATQALAARQPDSFWSAIQSLLRAAAQLGELGVPAESPLRQVAFPSLNDWIASRPRTPLRLTNFGPHGVSPADPANFARYVDVDLSVIILFGQAFDIPDLLAAIAGLQQTTSEELRQMRALV